MNFTYLKRSLALAHRPLLAAIAILTILLLAACSSSGATDTAVPTATPAAAEQAAATDTPAAPAASQPSTDTQAAPSSAVEVPPPAEVSEGAASALEPTARADMYSAAPPMTIDPQKIYYATFKTERGDIRVQLFADRAPQTVNNFVFLAREGFYNDTVFHRVLDGFMAQGGDPTGTGMGGPGYTFGDEFNPSLTFDRPGLLAMANSGPSTNGSQFFITFAPTEWLNNLHTIFGEVVSGQDVLDQHPRRDPNESPSSAGDKLYTVLIEESDTSELPTPLPPTPTPTPYAPSSPEGDARPLATVEPSLRYNYFNTAPEMVIDPTKHYSATVATSKGDMVLELYADQAPVSVNNFVVLANLGFFDGLPVNVNDPNNALVFGSPDNNAQHDVGYQVAAEVNLSTTLGIGSLSYVPFRLPSGEVGTSGSQLLIARIVPPAEANTQFSFFGKLVSGEEVLNALTTEDTITSVTVSESE